MLKAKYEIILASQSPRRTELLSSIGIEHRAIPADIDETPFPNEAPVAHVERLAKEKAEKVAQNNPEAWVIAADTIVVCDGEILGKPKSEDDAYHMLEMLQNSTHEVITGFCFRNKSEEKIEVHSDTTKVTFIALSHDEILGYIATGEPMDKAGSYGIQGTAGTFVATMSGSNTNVIGLPMNLIYQQLLENKIATVAK